jgi:hypothetical protein
MKTISIRKAIVMLVFVFCSTLVAGIYDQDFDTWTGASSPYSYNVQEQAFTSEFESMNVNFSPNGFGTPQVVTMFLDGNDFRQGVSVFSIPYLGGSKFDFSAVTTNAGEMSYGCDFTGDFPVNGDLVLDGADVIITNNLFNQVVFRVDETDMSFSASDCKYMDFENWPTTAGYTDSTYDYPSAGVTWKAYNACITNDTEREFRGKAAYLNSTGATSYVMSPAVTPEQGFGELTFWYRNFSGAGDEAAFDIQVSDTGGTLDTEWATVTNVTDIYTTEYIRFTLLMNDRAGRYVRIKNTGASNLCVDDILIGYAGAGVVLDNIVADLSSPNVLYEVYVYADITALQGANNIVAKLYYRFGTSGNYTEIGMINKSGITYDAVSPFPTGCNGTLQYYFEITFEGSRGQETVVYPSGGATIPYELEYTDISYEQDFDIWSGAPQTTYTNSSDSTGWSVANTAVKAGLPFVLAAHSSPYCAVIDYSGYVQTPMLTNSFGVLSFWYGFSSAGYQIDIQTSTDGVVWTTIDSVGFAGFREWNQYRKVFPIKGINASYIRLKSSAQQAGRFVLIDDIEVRLPSSMVTIGTQTRTPAYVSYNEPVDVNAIFSSVNSGLPAIDIQGKIFYRKKGSGLFSSVDMSNTGYGNYLGTIPAGVVDAEDTIEYYIQSTFDGYHSADDMNFSPTYSPAGVVSMGTTYYTPPTNFYEFTTRHFQSDVETMTIIMTNSVDSVVTPVQMSLYSDDIWQGIIEMGEYEEAFINISAANIKISTANIATNVVYGDGMQVETTPPLVATAKPDGASIEVVGVKNQQYVVRLNMDTEEYTVLACDSQTFEKWFLDSIFYAVGDNSPIIASKWSVDFESWSTNTQSKASINFNDESWLNPPKGQMPWSYPSDVSGWTYGYWDINQFQLWNSKLVNDPTNNIVVAQIEPEKQQGFMFPTFANGIHDQGVGEVSFKYRVVDTNVYAVLADPSLTNALPNQDYKIDANIKGIGENSDDGCFCGIRLRQIDDNNYVECRVVQHFNDCFYLEIWLCENGVLTRKDVYGFSSSYKGSLTEGGRIIVRVKDDSITDDIRASIYYYSPSYESIYLNKYFSAPNLVGQTGTFAFVSSDVNMVIEDYTISEYYDFTDTCWEESFNEGEFSIMQFNNNWVKGIGQMERIGVGSLASTPSTGLAVSIDPGDNTADVPNYMTSWINYSYERGLTNLDYQKKEVNVNTADNAFAIIQRTTAGEDEYSPIRISDIEISGWIGDVLTKDNWLNHYGWVQSEKYILGGMTLINNYVELRKSRTPAGERQYIASPRYSSLGSFGFRYMVPTGSAVPTVKVWKADDLLNPSTWELITDSVIDASLPRDTWLFFSRSVADVNDGYLIIENASSDGSDAIVDIDAITIYPSSGGKDEFWSVYNACITGNEDVFEGTQSGFLNLNSILNTLGGNDYNEYDPYIRTPRLENGIGEICFWYAMLPNASATLPYALLRIETSGTGDDADWDEFATFEVTSQEYQFFSTNIYDTVSKYIRFSNVTSTNGVPERLAFDNLLVVEPYATTLDIENVRIIPEQPLEDDAVKVRVDLTNYKFGPYNINPVVYYYYSTNLWAQWSSTFADGARSMELIASNDGVYTYETTGSIPANPADTCVQYYVSVSYDGELYVDLTSPKIFRQALDNPTWYEPVNYYEIFGSSQFNNPYYVVFDCMPGSVWFNEINVIDGAYNNTSKENTGTNSYVELAGKDGIDISGWMIDLYNNQNVKEMTYTVAANTVLSNDNNGYGFWLIGAPEVADKDMAFTHDFEECFAGPNYLRVDGGVVLRRKFGSAEYKICYNSTNLVPYGFQYIGDDTGVNNDEFVYKSLQLTGIGSNYYDFVWSWEDGFTPREQNTAQTLNSREIETTVEIVSFRLVETNVYLITTSTKDLTAPAIWYTTNLSDSASWEELPGVTTKNRGDVVQQKFSLPSSSSSPSIYYRIKGVD